MGLPQKNKNIIFYVIIFIIVLCSRYGFSLENNYFFWSDSGHFALAIKDYSLVNDRPQLPGYFLHVQFGKLMNLITHDEQTTLIWLAVLYSSFASIAFFGLVKKWIPQNESILLTLLLATNPYFWFFGSVPEIYSFDVLFSTVLVLAFMSGSWIYITPIILALGDGFRQSSGVLLLPLYIYLWIMYLKNNKVNYKWFFLNHVFGIILFFAWFLAMTSNVGGVSNYIQLYIEKSTMPPALLLQNLSAFVAYGLYIVLPLFFALIIWFFKRNNDTSSDQNILKLNKKIISLTIAWLLFPVLFFAFYHVAKGYLLIISAAFILLLVPLLNKKIITNRYLIIAVTVQIIFYFFFPYISINPEMDIVNEKRKVSREAIYFNRLGSTMLMSHSHIRAREKYNREFDNGISNKLTDIFSRNYLTLDPSNPLSIRELQARYPNRKLCALIYYTKDTYIFSYGLEQSGIKGQAGLLSKSIISGYSGFVDIYLKDHVKILMKYPNLTFYIVEDSQITNYLKIMNNYFSRNNNENSGG